VKCRCGSPRNNLVMDDETGPRQPLQQSKQTGDGARERPRRGRAPCYMNKAEFQAARVGAATNGPRKQTTLALLRRSGCALAQIYSSIACTGAPASQRISTGMPVGFFFLPVPPSPLSGPCSLPLPFPVFVKMTLCTAMKINERLLSGLSQSPDQTPTNGNPSHTARRTPCL
jgi:hypothetical protein